MVIRKTLSIDKEHEDWLKDNSISLSAFVRKKIKEEQNKFVSQ